MMLFRSAPTPPAASPIPTSTPTKVSPNTNSCPKCGTEVAGSPEAAQERIRDLESQVKALNEKAAIAVDKLAEYEDQVRALQTKLQQQPQPQPQPQPRTSTPVSTPEQVSSPSQQLSPPRGASRLASFTSYFVSRPKETPAIGTSSPTSTNLNTNFNQSTPNLISPHPLSTTSTPTIVSRAEPQPQGQGISLQSLQSTLESERSRRLLAETSLNQTQTELEELTAQLFGQANEMVAAERKARYKLEERVKVLEGRDGEKRRRLERLEKALQRIERVRGLVERRNTVDGYDAAANLDVHIPGSGESSETEMKSHGKTNININNSANSNTNTNIKRKVVATNSALGKGPASIPISQRDRDRDKDRRERERDRDRARIDRKGTL